MLQARPQDMTNSSAFPRREARRQGSDERHQRHGPPDEDRDDSTRAPVPLSSAHVRIWSIGQWGNHQPVHACHQDSLVDGGQDWTAARG